MLPLAGAASGTAKNGVLTTRLIHQEAAGRGLFSRVKADTYLLAPPAVITDDQLDRTVAILTDSIRAVLG